MDPSDYDKRDLDNGASGGHGPTYGNLLPGAGPGWLRSTIENSSEVVTIVDPDGTLRYASPAFGRVFGHDPGEAVGKMNVLNLVHPDDLPHVLEETEKALSGGGVVINKAEYRFRHADGSWKWVESVGTYLLDDPQVGGVVVQTRDLTERKEAEEALRRSEEALRESERRLTSVVSSAHAYAYRCLNQPGWPNEYASDYALELTGYPPEDLLVGGKVRLGDLIVEEDRGRVREEVQEALAEGRGFELRYAIRRKDGQVRHVLDHGQGVFDEDGSVVALEGLLYDVTELVETEQALKESEERFRTLVERVPAITYIQEIRRSSETVYVSPQVVDVVGYTPEECISSPDLWARILHPDDKERVLEEDRRTNETGDPFAMEYRQLAKDGHLVWLRDEATLVRDEQGKPLYWLGVQTDITDRKLAEEALREAEERYRTLVEQIPAVTYIDPVDDPDTSLYTSPQIEKMLGYTPEEWRTNKLWKERLHPDDRKRILAADERFEASGEPFKEEYRLLARDGSVVWVREEAVLIKDEEGEPLYWQGVFYDLTERKEAEGALTESERRFRSSFDDAAVGMALVGLDGRWLRVNRSLCEILGYPQGELLKKTFQDLTHSADLQKDLEHLRRLVAGEIRTYQMEKRYRHKEGRLVWAILSVSLVRDEGGGPLYFVSQVQDIGERKRMEGQLQRQALHDDLTGLPNRKLFVDRLQHALDRTRRRRGRKVAVLFVDLDNFKGVNDSLGHDAGDLLLTVVAQRLKGCLRPEDTLARLGGDEFAVLLEDVEDPDEAVRVAERIAEGFRSPFQLDGRELYARASIGIATGDARTKTPEDLLRDADTAMYRAKDSGSEYRMFDPAMHERALLRLELENDLRRAIERGEFVVHYQPIVRLDDWSAWGVEALVRWDHPERGLLNPDEFVPIAEESGLVVPMGMAVMEEACRMAKEWQEGHPRMPPLAVSVNLSARQLARPDLAEAVEGALRRTGLEGNCLTLDVTETVYVKALEGNTAALERLRALGVKVSIDDFGTGYSSLAYLKRLPADALKIDKAFVKGLGEDVEDTTIVRTIIELAHTLGMEVIAEGVEEWSQAVLLAEMGCDMAQGYHFSRPVPPEQVPGFLGA